MLWKAVDCEGPAGESRDIANFGWLFRINIYIPGIAEGDPATPRLLDMIHCRAISVLRRYVDDTSSTPFCNCHGRQDCLNTCTATREISKSSEEDTVKQITLATTFQMILMMVLNKTMRIEVFLTTKFRIIWMLRNKDKEIMLWKAVDCEGPAGESRDIANFGWLFRINIYIPGIAEGDPATPRLLDMIHCRAISVLRRYVDDTSSTPFCNCHGRQDCLNPCTATREISKSSEEDTVKQITLATTFQMILILVLNKTMRIEVFLTTKFRIIWMLRNKDKEIKEK